MQNKIDHVHTPVSHRAVRMTLLLLNLLVGLTAVAGGLALLIGVVQMPVAWLYGTAFSSYQVPGLILALVVGGSALIAATAVLVESEWDAFASLIAGVILVGWIVCEVVIIGLNSWLQPFYFVLGLLILGLATRLLSTELRHSS